MMEPIPDSEKVPYTGTVPGQFQSSLYKTLNGFVAKIVCDRMHFILADDLEACQLKKDSVGKFLLHLIGGESIHS